MPSILIQIFPLDNSSLISLKRTPILIYNPGITIEVSQVPGESIHLQKLKNSLTSIITIVDFVAIPFGGRTTSGNISNILKNISSRFKIRVKIKGKAKRKEANITFFKRFHFRV